MILLTGATGRLGGEIIRLLRQAGVEVRALIRVGSEYFWLNDTGSTYFFGDLRDPSSLKRALAGCSHIIHAAGVQLETRDNHHHSTTLRGGSNLVQAAKEVGVEHLVTLGSAAVTHSSQVEALRCQAQVETELANSGISHTIIRCAPFLEEFADLALRAATGSPTVLWGSGGARISPIARRDAALLAVASLDHPQARNRVITLGGPETSTPDQILEHVCDKAGVGPGSIQRLSGLQRRLARRSLSLVLGRRWENYIDWKASLHDVDQAIEGTQIAERFKLPLTPLFSALELALTERHPREDPLARDERVVHRQFHATVYSPGETPINELPAGPDDRST